MNWFNPALRALPPDLVVLAIELERFVRPEKLQKLKRFVEQLDASLPVGDFANITKSGIESAKAYGEDCPSVR